MSGFARRTYTVPSHGFARGALPLLRFFFFVPGENAEGGNNADHGELEAEPEESHKAHTEGKLTKSCLFLKNTTWGKHRITRRGRSTRSHVAALLDSLTRSTQDRGKAPKPFPRIPFSLKELGSMLRRLLRVNMFLFFAGYRFVFLLRTGRSGGGGGALITGGGRGRGVDSFSWVAVVL